MGEREWGEESWECEGGGGGGGEKGEGRMKGKKGGKGR